MEQIIFGFLLGFCFGGILLQHMYKHWVIAQKAKDGTAEYIGGKCLYIITEKDWRLLEAWRLPILRGESERAAPGKKEGQAK